MVDDRLLFLALYVYSVYIYVYTSSHHSRDNSVYYVIYDHSATSSERVPDVELVCVYTHSYVVVSSCQ